jgi:hypothetical protein
VANLCSTDSVMNLTYNFDESDVDTSLHLWKNFTMLVSLVSLFCFSNHFMEL